MPRRKPEREALWAEVERELRRFVRECEAEPEWLWPEPTVRLIRAVRPMLALLDGHAGTPQGRSPGGGG